MATIDPTKSLKPARFVGRAVDLTGQTFGSWTVLNFSSRDRNSNCIWLCRCSCGTVRKVLGRSLRAGDSMSCGCLQKQSIVRTFRTHGMTGTPEYGAWINMIQRCTNPKCRVYSDYGGRGIRVHESWVHSFQAFYNHIGPRPERYSLDRIDNNGHYEPGNVRWSPRSIQGRNRRSCLRITHNGETLTAIEWSDRLGISANTIRCRARYGLPPNEIFCHKGLRRPPTPQCDDDHT